MTDWQRRTHPRSGTAIIRHLMDAGPRESRTYDEQVKTLLDRIRKEQGRVARAKALVRTPDLEQKILKKEGHINRMIFNLQVLNAKKQETDKRELSKFKNNPKDHSYVGQAEGFVRLEKGKVRQKTETVLVEHRNKPLGLPKMSNSVTMERVRHERAEEARRERMRRISIMELYEEQKEKGLHSEASQKEIERAFEEIEEISEEDFEKMMNGE